jgi:hypothetical protein
VNLGLACFYCAALFIGIYFWAAWNPLIASVMYRIDATAVVLPLSVIGVFLGLRAVRWSVAGGLIVAALNMFMLALAFVSSRSV